MGIGNVGQKLTYHEEELNTYLSRDGGLTWHEVKSGAYIMEYGDHGSIIVMAPMYKPTKTVSYSLDYGNSWKVVQISDSFIDVDNIVAEPCSISQNFIIHGEYSGSESGKSVVLSLDFSKIGIR